MRDYTLVVEYKRQNDWSHVFMWLEMTFAGVFCGMFVGSYIYKFELGLLVSFILAVIGKGALLLVDLGKPARVLRVLARPGKSWISNGTWGFGLFGIFGLLTVLPVVFPGVPWATFSGTGFVLGILACAFALFVMIYDGFLLADSKGIAVWTLGNLPLLFGVNAALGGLGAMAVCWPMNDGSPLPPSLSHSFLALSVLSLISVYTFIFAAHNGPAGSGYSASQLQKGNLAFVFWGGMVICSILLPLLAGLLPLFGFSLSTALWQAIGAAAALGVLATRYGVLKCGTYSPAI